MDGDKKLVQTLLERLSSRLPNQTGILDLDVVRRDEVVGLSRGTLIEVAKSQIDTVIRCLVNILDGISRQYDNIPSRGRPAIIFATQAYLLELLADCTTAHWDAVERKAFPNDKMYSNAIHQAPYTPNRPAHRREPPPLDDTLAKHAFDCILRLIAQPIMTDDHMSNNSRPNAQSEDIVMDGIMAKPTELDLAAHRVIEYLSASNWSLAYNIMQNKLRYLRTTASDDVEASGLQFMAHMWLNSKKLSLIIQEISQTFLPLRRSTQNIIATVLPDAIHNWIDTNPRDFVELHMTQRRLEGGADVLFDIATQQDNSTRRSIMWPLQTALVLLIPEVFWMAGMMGEAKSSGVARKAIFLENLRKNLRIPKASDIAATCLVNICQAASYFPANSDSALLSFALDVQNEMREEMFKKPSPGPRLEESMIDRELMTKAFVSLCHLSIDTVIVQLVPWCLDKHAPVSWKIAAFAGAGLLAQQANADDFAPLFTAIAPDIRDYLDAIGSSKALVMHGGGSVTGNSSNNGMNKMQQRNISSESIGSSELLFYILEFLTVRPFVLFERSPHESGPNPNPYGEQFVSNLLLFMTDDDELVRKSAAAFAKRLLAQDPLDVISGIDQTQTRDSRVTYYWKSTSTVAIALAKKLMEFDFRDAGLRGMLDLIHSHLDVRVAILNLQKEYTEDLPEMSERTMANVALEVSLLVLLCSSDLETCSIATHCIALLCEEGRMTENMEDLSASNLTIMRNYPVYSELSLQSFRLTGQVAFQKRLRKLLIKMTMPSPGILTAWEKIFGRWRIMCKHILSPGLGKSEDEIVRLYAEWRNYSGFLASISGCCIAELPSSVRVDDSTLVGLRWIDRLSIDGDGIPLLDRFMKQCLELLICKQVNVRESIREVLATELSPRLYGHLFRSLETELVSLFDFGGGPRDVATIEVRTLFVEQAAGLLKTIVERLEESQDTFLSVDLGALTLTLAKYLHPLAYDPNVMRVKIKMCLLIELVARKKEILNLRQEIRVRNHFLHLLSKWMSPPKGESIAPGSAVAKKDDRRDDRREDERSRLQRDLDRACLRALINVLYRLPLQPLDAQHDADLLDVKSLMFSTYLESFLSLLDTNQQDSRDRTRDIQALSLTRDENGSIVELVIRALSNLLSANVDVGLKYSLEIGYHEDLEIRTAFMHVLTDILTQGTEFGSLKDSAIQEKYEQLVSLLINNMDFVLALCECCPSTEVDDLTIALLNIFDSKGKGLALLKALIEQEVANTESESELLRRNCVATKMLSVFAKSKGSDYLRKTLQEKLERLIKTSEKFDLELDPARTTSDTTLDWSTHQIQRLTKMFIDEITASARFVPESFRQICRTITNCVTERFPEAKFTAVGAFIFLRFFCPAIVAPDSEGLVTGTPQRSIRRGLLLIAKIVQNLANNVLFGAKEPYMIPMNSFLTNNIYQVTAFLREISVASDEPEPVPEHDGFDFGSSVALHRFFYENWESVRQKLIFQDKSRRASNAPLIALRNPKYDFPSTLAKFTALISTLGTPPLDIAPGRPSISSTQPAYTRYQNFMLRHSVRSVESILSGRMVYDGGEAKDGTPVICLIMRNINVETVDQDLLLYCFLKIAAKLWHKPFAVLVDATCYSMNNEFSDEFFRKMDTLMPPELMHSFNRFYVYNMNSLYRKSFRKTLRHALRDPKSCLNTANIEIYLLGNLTELQQNFHLGSLHLPKETISLVTDARFVFQPVTRLSKSNLKGKIEVIVKVGSQYIQITTTKKQDILPQHHLQATVNDIFKISDVEEATTVLFPTDEKDVFGLKTDNGKTTTYFSSPKRLELLSRIKAAKSKYSKDSKPSKLNERVIRPEDVPGTLLNIALMNMASNDRGLRLSAYNLLCALCQAFHFNLEHMPLSARGLSIPADSVSLIVGFSTKLAAAEPQLTFDFLTEFFVGWDKAPVHQRPFNVLYMAPWLSNLKPQLLCTAEGDIEKGKERLTIIARKLIDITVQEPHLFISLQQNAWTRISNEEGLLDVFLDELVKAAANFGFKDPKTEIIGSIAASFNTVTIRGKVIARLRKALNRTSVRATRHLTDHSGWNEICVLLGICLAISFDSRVQAQIFLPELFHIITLVVNCGHISVRTAVHSLLVNTVHSICTSFPLEEGKLVKLRGILSSLSEPRYCLLFNLNRPATRDSSGDRTEIENPVSAMETITNLLLEIISVAAPSIDMANIWRARWMSLVASTAFQSNPSIQPRAFAVMGCLAREDIDDDLLYQVLVALRSGIARQKQDNDTEMLISIVTSLTKMMDNLPATSRYLLQLFWLALALVRGGSGHIFNCAAGLLEAVLRVIAASGEFKNDRLAHVLLTGRIPVEDAAYAIDDLYGIRFEHDSFHFAITVTLLKGLHDSTTKATAIKTMSAFLEVAAQNVGHGSALRDLPYLGFIAARAPNPDELKEVFWMANLTTHPEDEKDGLYGKSAPLLTNMRDKALFLNAALAVVDFNTDSESVQLHAVNFFTILANKRPEIFVLLYDIILDRLDEVLLTSQNTVLLHKVRAMICATSANPAFNDRRKSKELLTTTLDEYGFSGIWTATNVSVCQSLEKKCMSLTDDLVRLIIQ